MSLDRVAPIVVLALAALCPAAQAVVANDKHLSFDVVRDGSKIGTSTIDVQGNDENRVVQVATHIDVKLAFITLYRFDQTDTEHWVNGQLLTINATTDDNGTVQRTSARSGNDGIIVDADGVTRKVASPLVPVSFWKEELLSEPAALNTQTGKVAPLKVADKGEEQLTIRGQSTAARHFALRSSFSQDVWYDSNGWLVRMEFQAKDGSTISYQLV